MIFAIKPFEIHDGDGIRTTVFFKGCPLRCRWCHNPESFGFEREMMFDAALCAHCMACTALCAANVERGGEHVFVRDDCTLCGRCEDVCPHRAFELAGRVMSAEEIAAEVLRDEIFLKRKRRRCHLFGGEPLMQADLCAETARILKQHGMNVAVDTSGFVGREALDKIIPYTDTFLFDVKAIDDEVHTACTGVSNRQILENIRYVDSLGIPIEIRYPYVPQMNDGEVEAIGRFVCELTAVTRLRVLPYHNYAERKYACLGLTYPLPDIPCPTAEEIGRAVETLKACGVAQVVHN